MSQNERVPLNVAQDVAKDLTQILTDSCCLEENIDFRICGSIRRGTLKTCGDIDLAILDTVLITEQARLARFIREPEFCKSGKNKGRLKCGKLSGMKVELYVGPRNGFGALTLFATGSPGLNVLARRIASDHGWKLNQYGLYTEEGIKVCDASEEYSILQALGLGQYENPCSRELSMQDAHKIAI